MKKTTLIVISVILGIVVFLALGFLTVKTVFSVRTIEIVGNSMYSDEDILETIGFGEGDVIFFASDKKFAERLAKNHPFVNSVIVTKDYPSRIVVKIVEESADFYFESVGKTVVVSHSGKVLYLGDKLPEEYSSLIRVSLPAASIAMTGFLLEFKDEGDKAAVSEVITALKKWDKYDEIDYIDMSSRFNIKIVLRERFDILLGDRRDIATKLKFVSVMISKLTNGEKGTINVKDVKKGYLILDE